MGSRGRPLFDLNELPTEGCEESDVLINLQPQKARPSLNSHAIDFFPSSEDSQKIHSSSAFSHEPSVSGFQPFVKPNDAHIDTFVKQQSSNHVNLFLASSSSVIDHSEYKKASPPLDPDPTQAAEREEGEWSDLKGSADASLSSSSYIKHEGVKTDNSGIHYKKEMVESLSFSCSNKVADSISHGIKHSDVHEVIETADNDRSSRASFGTDSQPAEWVLACSRISDGSVKGDTSTDGQEEPSLVPKQREIKGTEAIHARKSVNIPGKKHKLDKHKEAMLGKKRSRQTMFLNLEDIKQAGSIRASTPRRQPLSSTLTSRPAKEMHTVPSPAERGVERQGQPTTNDHIHLNTFSNEQITPTQLSDRKSESNGDTNAGVETGSSRVGCPSEISSEVCPPTISREGSWKQPMQLRQLKHPPQLCRKPAVGSQSTENSKLGYKKLPNLKKQPMHNTQYQDTSIERLLREVTNDKFWRHPGTGAFF